MKDCRAVQQQQLEQQIQSAQNDILKMIAYGDPLGEIMDRLCRNTEVLAPGVVSSVLAVDAEGMLRPLAGPRLPADYHHAINGVAIGPTAGSCGTAAWRGEPVEVTDIETDPLWDGFRDLALRLGLKACWSSPIKARDGRVVGTFAFYYRIAREPVALERAIVSTFTHLCAIAIEQDEIRARNHRLAHRDALTGLSNRLSFTQAITERLNRNEAPFALILVDLDHFKSVNDTMGHAVGDALLCALAARLKTAGGPASTAFRLGGDEFAIVIDGAWSQKALTDRCARIIASASEAFRHDDVVLTPDISLGAVIHDGSPGMDAAVLSQNADFALYHAKENARGSVVVFTEGMRTTITRRFNMMAMLDEALLEGRVEAYYQPIVRLDTGEIVGLEALARLRTASGDIISAGQFQEALKDSRLAYRLTGVMLGQVAADIKRWLDQGIPFQHVGVNFSSADFNKGNMERRIVETFGYMGVPLKHLILEVTETVMMSRDQKVAHAVGNLRASGMRVALDDFGTGYASLTHLLDFPVDIVKIDKSFVDRLVRDKRSLVIVRGLVEMGLNLDMRLVAEGIETPEQADCLLSLGCKLGQGFLYAKPQSAEATTALLHRFAQKPDGATTSRPRLRSA